jgi:hypothetical protein
MVKIGMCQGMMQCPVRMTAIIGLNNCCYTQLNWLASNALIQIIYRDNDYQNPKLLKILINKNETNMQRVPSDANVKIDAEL